MPANTVQKLNAAQKAQILAWIGEGFSDVEIVKKIAFEREDAVAHDGAPWPEYTRQAVAHHRERWADRFGELQANTFDVAISTGLAKKQVLVRRASRRTGQLDHLIDLIEREVEQLFREGVARGTPYVLEDSPDVIEADWTGGRGNPRVPAIPTPRAGAPADDPRYKRLMDLLHVLPKHHASHEKYLQLLARLGGLGDLKTPADEQAPPQERRRRAEDLMQQIEDQLRERARVPR